MTSSLANRARGHWKSILSGIMGNEYFTGKHGPCPLCGGVDRFRFDDKNGAGTYFCGVCGAGGGIRLLSLHQKLTSSQAWSLVEKLLLDATAEEIKKPKDYSGLIKKLLMDSVTGHQRTEVELYLRNRGLNAPLSIRQSSYVDFSDPQKPKYEAMVCYVEKNGRLAGLHLTLLKDGKKAPIPNPRRLLKVSDGSLNGAAIRLYDNVWSAMNSTLLSQLEVPVNFDKPLIVGEGVETVLSAYQLFKNDTFDVVVAGDNDATHGGQAAAYTLAHKLCAKGRSVDVRIPPNVGEDWNDVLMRGIAK